MSKTRTFHLIDSGGAILIVITQVSALLIMQKLQYPMTLSQIVWEVTGGLIHNLKSVFWLQSPCDICSVPSYPLLPPCGASLNHWELLPLAQLTGTPWGCQSSCQRWFLPVVVSATKHRIWGFLCLITHLVSGVSVERGIGGHNLLESHMENDDFISAHMDSKTKFSE